MPPEGQLLEGAPSWLARYAPEEWIRQALGELGRAEQRLRARDRAAAAAGLKRAAGMALNGALLRAWRPWGRTYAEHLAAIAHDASVPPEVQAAATLLCELRVGQDPGIVRLTPPSESARWLEATKTIMAHAYAVVHGHVGRSE